MTIDTDASDHRNPAYNAMLINDNGTFSGSRITAVNFDIVSRLRLQARGVKTINSIHVLMNGTRFHAITFSPAIKVAWGLNTAETPTIRIPYSKILAALPAGSQSNGDKFKLSFEFDVTTKESQPLTIVAIDTIEFLPVWNLKPEVTAASDVDNGLYSRKISAYGSQKLRTFVRSMVAHRTAMQSDSTKAFNLYINDGSLPFGGSFSGVHNTHNTGNILDMRPLGNSGTSSQHYDFNFGAQRLADLAVIWAESTAKYLACASKTDAAEKTTCLATQSALFISKFNSRNTISFETRRDRVTRWIKLNQQLGEIPLPSSTTTVKFNFSSGETKFDDLCAVMTGFYFQATDLTPEANICTRKFNSTAFATEDRFFQIRMLNGRLPNGEEIGSTTPKSVAETSFVNAKLKEFDRESVHYDHFHLEINE